MDDPAIIVSAVPLSEDQARALQEVAAWECQALIDLGTAQLAVADAEIELHQARGRLAAQTEHARQMREQHQRVLAMVSEVLGLPAGEWVYDAAQGMLVKQDRKGLTHA
jgi:hypothetical protein